MTGLVYGACSVEKRPHEPAAGRQRKRLPVKFTDALRDVGTLYPPVTPRVRTSGCALSPSSTVTQRPRLGAASGAVEGTGVRFCADLWTSAAVMGAGGAWQDGRGDPGGLWLVLPHTRGRGAGLHRWESSEPTHLEAPVMPSIHQILGRANERVSCTCVKMQPPAAGGQTLSPLGVSQQAQPSKLREASPSECLQGAYQLFSQGR